MLRLFVVLASAIVFLVGSGLAQSPLRRVPVDLALVLAVDTSGSITEASWRLQRDGIADAVASDAFAAALAGGQIGRVSVSLVQWGSSARVALPWRLIENGRDARAAAVAIRELPRSESGGTCLARAVIAATVELEPWAEVATRLVIDVSGDGSDNCNGALAEARAAALAGGITINGLPIVTPAEPLIDQWYGDNVIGGPGAFLIVADGYARFAEAFRRKLTTEVAEVPQ